jgi:hypothetical protein
VIAAWELLKRKTPRGVSSDVPERFVSNSYLYLGIVSEEADIF